MGEEIVTTSAKIQENIAKPYKCKGRRYNSEDSAFLQQFVDELVKNGLVEENPNSECASPVVVVEKSDGSRRICVDL